MQVWHGCRQTDYRSYSFSSRDKEITAYRLKESDSELISLLICVTAGSRARMSYKRWKPWKTWEMTPWRIKRSSIWNRGSGLQRARNKWKRLMFNNPALCVHSKIHCFPSLHKEQSAAVRSLQQQKKNSNSLQKEHLALIHWLEDKSKKIQPTNQNKKIVCTSSSIKTLYGKCSKDIMSLQNECKHLSQT